MTLDELLNRRDELAKLREWAEELRDAKAVDGIARLESANDAEIVSMVAKRERRAGPCGAVCPSAQHSHHCCGLDKSHGGPHVAGGGHGSPALWWLDEPDSFVFVATED